jgi:thiamine kinase-like enzyme
MADIAGAIAALEPRLGRLAEPPAPLRGGITNRNFRARLGGSDYVVRLPGKDTQLLGISREAERIANEAAAELGIAPAVVAVGEHFLVTRYVAAEPIDGDLLRGSPEGVARALRAFHDSGIQLPVRFWVPDLLDDYAAIVAERGGSLPAVYRRAQDLVRRIADVLPLTEPVPCHDDLLPSNLLDAESGDGTPGGVLLVDWEYAGMGHRMFDLGNLAVNNDFDDQAEERLLAGYFRAGDHGGEGEGAGPGRRAALRLMRVMSDAREAAWGIVQRTISELEFDFGAYATKHFDRLSRAAAGDEFEDWLRDAASA